MATLKTVDNALSVLTFLVHHGGSVGVRELADEIGVARSTLHRLLATLEKHGYIQQDPATRKYQLGEELSRLVSIGVRQEQLGAVARSHVADLAERLGATAHFAVRSGWACVYVGKHVANPDEQMASEIGWRKPLYCTGVGKILLAYAPASVRSTYIEQARLKRLTAQTITSPDVLSDELDSIRRDGIAYDRGEVEPGLYCIATPVRNNAGEVVAALSVSSRQRGPALLDDLETKVRLQRAAESICESLSVAQLPISSLSFAHFDPVRRPQGAEVPTDEPKADPTDANAGGGRGSN